MTKLPPCPLLANILAIVFAVSGAPLLAPPRSPAAVSQLSVKITGRIERLSGNQLPGPGSGLPSRPAAAQEIVVLKGCVEPVQLGDPFLPVARLKAPVLGRGRSDAAGVFAVELPAAGSALGEVTVMLAVEGGYYLNSFAASGCFSTVRVDGGEPGPILLRDSREAVF